MPSVPRRGGAPPWRRVFPSLGFEDADPVHDAVRSERLGAQVKKRTPEQLVVAIGELERALTGFEGVLRLADDYRARALAARGRHALALNELWRFVSVARETSSAILGRAGHPLDDKAETQRLQEAAAAFAVALERGANAAVRAYLREHVDVWTEPAPGLAEDVRQRRWVAVVLTLLALALLAGVVWLWVGGEGQLPSPSGK